VDRRRVVLLATAIVGTMTAARPADLRPRAGRLDANFGTNGILTAGYGTRCSSRLGRTATRQLASGSPGGRWCPSGADPLCTVAHPLGVAALAAHP
jgi:hypothetical protein